MKVALGKFARSSIETRFGADIDAGIQAAVLHYARRLKSAWPPVGIPWFCRGKAAVSSDTVSSLEVLLDPELEEELECEARRNQVPVEQVLTHAVFVYLADMDSASQARLAGGAPLH